MLNIKNLKSKLIDNYTVYYRNEDELAKIYDEVFVNKEYEFTSQKKSPFLIDCGSHIGLTILYFKTIYPQSKIIGFEPNPENFEILNINIKRNHLKDVKVFNYALSDRKMKTNLHASLNKNDPWTWGDTIIYNMWQDQDGDRKILVQTVKLSSYIKHPVDLIKIDIEGSEQKVIQEIEKKLKLVKEIVMEYHGTKTSVNLNNYIEIEKVLKKNNFSLKTYAKNSKVALPAFVAHLRRTSSFFIVRAKKNSRHN